MELALGLLDRFAARFAGPVMRRFGSARADPAARPGRAPGLARGAAAGRYAVQYAARLAGPGGRGAALLARPGADCPGACPGLDCLALGAAPGGPGAAAAFAGPFQPGEYLAANLSAGHPDLYHDCLSAAVCAGRAGRLSPGRRGRAAAHDADCRGSQRSRRLAGRPSAAPYGPGCLGGVCGGFPAAGCTARPGVCAAFGARPGRVGHGTAAARLSAKRTAHCRLTGARRCQQPGTTGPQPGGRDRCALVGRLADPRAGAGARFTCRLPFAGARRGWRNFP